MYAWFCLLAIAAGTLIPLQAGMNAQLRLLVQSPWYATLVSVFVSLVSVSIFCLIIKAPFPAVAALGQVPWWAWSGGVVGVVYICLALMLAPKLGATALIASLIAGQLICSLLLDQFALIGFVQHGINAGRAAGVLLLIIGALLIQKY